MKKFLLLLSSIFVITACSDNTTTETNNSATEQKTIKIISSPGDFADMIRNHIGPELQKRGYKYELRESTNGILPNQSVVDGSADLNLFQHKPYLDEYNAQAKTNLYPLVQVPTAPLAIYKAKSQSLDDVKAGSQIAIPSNVTNFARGLRILESLGWIQLDPNADPIIVGEQDIIANPKGVKILAIDAPQVVRARSDVEFAIINGNFAQDANIPDSDILRTEPGKTFVNWIVIADQNRESDWAKAIIDIVNSQGYKDYVKNNFPAFYNLPPAWEK